ncbi:MAG: response regulator transcription factor [Actinoplanes sp.]
MRTNTAGHQVLLVANDTELLESLVTPLGLAGYRVRSAATGADAWAQLAARTVDLLIVDGGHHDIDALARGRRLTPADRPPVLCLTSCDELDRLMPELGSAVEDYVTKPCRITELLARAEVLLRGRRPDRRENALCHGDLLLDDLVCRAWRGDRPLRLTAAEYRLLRHLLVNAEQVLSKDQLAWQVWGESRGDNTIERLVSRLRRKVDRDAPALIHTDRGFGYRLGGPGS